MVDDSLALPSACRFANDERNRVSGSFLVKGFRVETSCLHDDDAVTIWGEAVHPGLFFCAFNIHRTTQSVFISSSLMRCRVPEMFDMHVQVELLEANSIEPFPVGSFLNYVPFSVRNIVPSSGYFQDTEATVTIFGKSFCSKTSDYFCSFGDDDERKAIVLSSTSIACQIAPKHAGNISIGVRIGSLGFGDGFVQ
eukprot:182999-Rhodomonas_salina.1